MGGEITLRYGTMRSLLLAMFAITGAKAATAFEGRIKNLKRLDFPASVRGSTQARINYTLTDTMALGVAIRLIGAYVPPAAAIRLVTEGLGDVVAMACDAISMAIAGPQANDAARTILVFSPAALGDLGTRPPRAGRYDAPVGNTALHILVDGTAAACTSGALAGGAAKDGVVVDALSFSTMLADGLKAAKLEPRQILMQLMLAVPSIADDGDRPSADDRSRYLWHVSRLLDGLEAYLDQKDDTTGRAMAMTDLRMVLTPSRDQHDVAGAELATVPDYPGMATLGLVMAALPGIVGHPAAVITDHMPETPRMMMLGWMGAKDARDLIGIVRAHVRDATRP